MVRHGEAADELQGGGNNFVRRRSTGDFNLKV